MEDTIKITTEFNHCSFLLNLSPEKINDNPRLHTADKKSLEFWGNKKLERTLYETKRGIHQNSISKRDRDIKNARIRTDKENKEKRNKIKKCQEKMGKLQDEILINEIAYEKLSSEIEIDKKRLRSEIEKLDFNFIYKKAKHF
jgi:hypothetical protein